MGWVLGLGNGIVFKTGGGKQWQTYWNTRKPSNCQAVITGSTTATVTWDDAVSDANGLKVYVSDDGGVTKTLKSTIAFGVETADVTGLNEDTQYIFYVHAYKGTKESDAITDTKTTFMAEAQAYFALMSTQLSNYRKGVVNARFKAFETGGYLSKLEVLQVYFMPDIQVAKLNAIANANHATDGTVAPVFFPFSGYKGNGSTMFLNSGFDASLAVKYSQNSSSIGRYAVLLGGTGATNDFGAISNTGGRNIALISKFNATTAIAEVNTAAYNAADNVVTTPAIGSITLSRGGETTSKYSQNAEAEATNTRNSVTPPSGNVYILATNNAGTAIQFCEAKIGAFWAGAELSQSEKLSLHAQIQLWYDQIFENVKFTGNIGIIGDSLIAQYKSAGITYSAIAYFLRYTGTLTDVSTPNETIAQQKTRYDALAAGVKSALNYVFIQIGLNDVGFTETTATIMTRYQDLVDDVIANSPSAKIICGTMTPAKQRFIDVYGAVNGATAYQQWVDMNEAIKGNGVNAITGVDQVVSGHTDLTNDGSDNLAAAYDIGDHIHGNNDLRAIIASSWNTAV